MPPEPDVLLFSYGTLRDPAVQKANFGRLLEGEDDALPGWETALVEITDPRVLAESGLTHHPIVRRSSDPGSAVSGTVFRITAEELAAADDYEVSDYARMRARLASGRLAWVYVAAEAAASVGDAT